LTVIALAVRQVSFGMFMMAVTPIVVLLSEIGQPGASEWMLAGMRALYTAIGGLLALAGCLILWPSWEPGRLVNEVFAAIKAHARYADAEISHLLGEASQDSVELARRAAGVASNNLEASLSRALQEPRHTSLEALETVLVIDAALRRFAGRLSTMQLSPSLRTELADPVWRTWREWIVQAMQGLASGVTNLPPKPSLSAAGVAADVLLRIARQIELIAGASRRIGAGT
jgi:uncharacterized membrane protein YccC